MISKKDVLKLETRRRLYDFIEKNPSLSIRELSRKINIPATTLLYHIKYLKKFGLINENQDGKYTRICVSQKLGTLDKLILNFLRKENSCKILLFLVWKITFSQIELSRELNISPPTVSYYLKKMVKKGILQEAPVEGDKIYPFVNGDMRTIQRKAIKSEKFYKRASQEVTNSIHKLIIANKNSLFDEKIIQSYIDYINDLGPGPNFTVKNIKDINGIIDNVADCFNSFFPPPFFC